MFSVGSDPMDKSRSFKPDFFYLMKLQNILTYVKFLGKNHDIFSGIRSHGQKQII